jgi:hypothetical protein
MDEPKRNPRARRRSLLILSVPLVGLAGVLALLAAGIARTRLRPTAVFLAMAATASIVYAVTIRLSARRARRLRAGPVPWGVRLGKPLWLSAPEASIPIEIGGVLAALLALVGCPGIGAGVMLAFGVFALMIPIIDRRAWPRALMFESVGLRVHTSGAAFLISWANITAVETVGPDQMQMTMLRLADTEAVVATATPATPRVRERVTKLLQDDTLHGTLTLFHWAAGLDGRTLARALEAARRGSGGEVN